MIASIREKAGFTLSQHIKIVALQFWPICVGKRHLVKEDDLVSALSDSILVPDIDLVLQFAVSIWINIDLYLLLSFLNIHIKLITFRATES